MQKTRRSKPWLTHTLRLLCPLLPTVRAPSMCQKRRRNWECLRIDEYHPLVKVRTPFSCSHIFSLTRTSLEYCRQHDNTHPITKEPLKPSDLITLHYSRKASGEYHDPITFKPFSEHSHIVAIATTGNVYLAESIKGGRDLVADVRFTKYVSYFRLSEQQV